MNHRAFADCIPSREVGKSYVQTVVPALQWYKLLHGHRACFCYVPAPAVHSGDTRHCTISSLKRPPLLDSVSCFDRVSHRWQVSSSWPFSSFMDNMQGFRRQPMPMLRQTRKTTKFLSNLTGLICGHFRWYPTLCTYQNFAEKCLLWDIKLKRTCATEDRYKIPTQKAIPAPLFYEIN